jgi:biotin transporter BioY
VLALPAMAIVFLGTALLLGPAAGYLVGFVTAWTAGLLVCAAALGSRAAVVTLWSAPPFGAATSRPWWCSLR